MKISEHIQQLAKVIQEHGDLEVVTELSTDGRADDGWYFPELSVEIPIGYSKYPKHLRILPDDKVKQFVG